MSSSSNPSSCAAIVLMDEQRLAEFIKNHTYKKHLQVFDTWKKEDTKVNARITELEAEITGAELEKTVPLSNLFMRSILTFLPVPTKLYATETEAKAVEGSRIGLLKGWWGWPFRSAGSKQYQALLDELYRTRINAFEATDEFTRDELLGALVYWYKVNFDSLIDGALAALGKWKDAYRPVVKGDGEGSDHALMLPVAYPDTSKLGDWI